MYTLLEISTTPIDWIIIFALITSKFVFMLFISFPSSRKKCIPLEVSQVSKTPHKLIVFLDKATHLPVFLITTNALPSISLPMPETWTRIPFCSSSWLNQSLIITFPQYLWISPYLVQALIIFHLAHYNNSTVSNLAFSVTREIVLKSRTLNEKLHKIFLIAFRMKSKFFAQIIGCH